MSVFTAGVYARELTDVFGIGVSLDSDGSILSVAGPTIGTTDADPNGSAANVGSLLLGRGAGAGLWQNTGGGTAWSVNSVPAMNVVEVFTTADMAGTLSTNTTYRIMAPLVYANGAELTFPATGLVEIISESEVNTITYSGTGTFFNGASTGSFVIRRQTFIATSTGTFIGITAASSASTAEFVECSIQSFSNVGTATGYGDLQFQHCGLSNNLSGLSVVGIGVFVFNQCGVMNTSTTSAPLLTIDATTTNFSVLHCGLLTLVGEVAILLNSSFVGRSQIVGNFRVEPGQLFDAAGLDHTSIYVESFHNSNNEDSGANGVVIVSDNTNGQTLINGTWVNVSFDNNAILAPENQRFTMFQSNLAEIQYAGIQDFPANIIYNLTWRATAADVFADGRFRVVRRRDVASITRVSSTATLTTTAPHGFSASDTLIVQGAVQSAYNVSNAAMAISSPTVVTYVVVGSPDTPATGANITCRSVGEPDTAVEFPMRITGDFFTLTHSSFTLMRTGDSVLFQLNQTSGGLTILTSHQLGTFR